MNTKQNKCKKVHTGFIYIIVQLVKAKDKEKIMKAEKKNLHGGENDLINS